MEGVFNSEGSPLLFLHLVGRLKRTPRTGWLRTIENPESVGDHSYRLAILGMLAPEGIDVGRCIFIALCHDMAESVVGDIPTFASVTKEHKFKLESFGFKYIESLLSSFHPTLGQKIMAGWVEYEEGKTAEARYIREMDKYECMVQALEYEQQTFGEKDLEEFQEQSSKITSNVGLSWLEGLRKERQAHFSKRNQRLPVVFLIGAPGTGKKTQGDRLCQKFGFQHIFLDDVIRQKSNDQTYPHSKFLKDCLEEEMDVPQDLKIRLLEQKISEGMQQGNIMSVVNGFPVSVEELVEFQEQVQKNNYALLINTSAQEMLHRVTSPESEAGDELNVAKGIRDFEQRNAGVENHMRQAEGYLKEINGDGSIEDVHGKILLAVEEIIRHSGMEVEIQA